MPEVRVLHVLEALEGGTARHLVDLVRTASGVEHHVAIPTRRVGGLTDRAAAGRMEAAGAVVHRVEMRRSPLRLANAAAAVRLLALVRRTRPDVVHAHSSIGGALGRVVATAAGRPRVYTPNGLATERAALVVERALGPLTDRLIATSDGEAALVLARRLVPAERLVTIPNGIEVDGWAPPANTPDLRAILGLGAEVPLVGTISRLVPQKAPERFTRLAATVLSARADAHAVLIGDGPLRDAVAAGRLPPDVAGRFHHLPALAEAGAALSQLDVFVLTSRFEGCPYSALEAMRAGTPVVLTDVVGNREVLVDGLSGHLVPEEDGAAMVALVIDLLDDPDGRRRLGIAGREHVRRFEVARMGQAVAALYVQLTAG
ncbi:MAG: glycosyltransferase family 4 protein [Acidimicrobiales bacterium]